MKPYHKINTMFKRDMTQKKAPIIEGAFVDETIEYLKNNLWQFTEKIDGTNIRVHVSTEGITYGGRTENAQIPATLITALDNIFCPKLVDICRKFREGVTFYGEGYGPKIQKGGERYRNDQSFIVFDIMVGPWMLRQEDVSDVCWDLKLHRVPVIGEGTLQEGIELVKAGLTSTFGDFEAEGIVARPLVELTDRAGRRIITKIKARDFRN